MTGVEAFMLVESGAGVVDRTFQFMLKLHELILADRRGCFQVPGAMVAVRIIGVAALLVINGRLWVRVHSHFARPDCSINFIRRLALLHPSNQCVERSRATHAAMPGAGRTEQSVEPD
jgi:hypothetical protein